MGYAVNALTLEIVERESMVSVRQMVEYAKFAFDKWLELSAWLFGDERKSSFINPQQIESEQLYWYAEFNRFSQYLASQYKIVVC